MKNRKTQTVRNFITILAAASTYLQAGSSNLTHNPIPNLAMVSQQKGIQKLNTILKENGDCTNPVTITDSIIFSVNSPKGFGKTIEIEGHQPDDSLYFEKEHNTIWYKFTAKESGNLTFDIIPVSTKDDYDFMLYRYNDKDFTTKFCNKEIKPIRTCISRNDKQLNSSTGLSNNESGKKYIHSGLGESYVKYVRVKKGDSFYLLVDNAKGYGKGHYVHLHYKTFAPGELYAGLMLNLGKIEFKDSDYEFMRETKQTLDSLYSYLVEHPELQIEIQGHVNRTREKVIPCVSKGKYFTELELSQKRAETIRETLVKKGIDAKRIKCKGYGSTRMKNPKPKTPKECYENIRAEIYILSLDYINEPATSCLNE